MRDNDALVAGQLADVGEVLVEMRDAMAKRQPAQVTVNVPETPVEVRVPEALPPHFHINFPPPAATEVRFQVPETAPPVVDVRAGDVIVQPPVPRAYNCRVTERDENGFILAFTVTPA